MNDYVRNESVNAAQTAVETVVEKTGILDKTAGCIKKNKTVAWIVAGVTTAAAIAGGVRYYLKKKNAKKAETKPAEEGSKPAEQEQQKPEEKK